MSNEMDKKTVDINLAESTEKQTHWKKVLL